jgi:hypothetical protein
MEMESLPFARTKWKTQPKERMFKKKMPKVSEMEKMEKMYRYVPKGIFRSDGPIIWIQS